MEQAADRILTDWRTKTRQSLCDGCGILLENASGTLVDFASKTENLQLQTSFFDASSLLAKHRERLFRAFCSNLEQAESSNGKPDPVVGGETLSLLERDAYERSVALETIASNCVQRNHQNFHAFSQRFSAIKGGRRFGIDDLPLNPRIVANAFEQAVSDLDISTKVRLILFTLFDRYVMSHLDHALSTINQQLAEAGVLPTIRYEIKKPIAGNNTAQRQETEAPGTHAREGTTNPPPSAPSPPAREPASRETSPPLEPPSAEDTMDAITRLVASRRQQKATTAPSGSSAVPATAGVKESQQNVLKALNSPQVARETSASPAMDVLTDPNNKIVIDRELLFRVRNTLKKQRALINSLMGDGRNISERDQNAIEIVGMLFEAMLDDLTLPDQLKALLSHLHTPYLKIAIKDPRCLSDTSHPARKLLGNMLQLGLRWVDPERLRSGIYPTLQHLVKTIIESPESADFESLGLQLEQKAAQLEQAKSVSEKRTLDTEKGKTTLRRARETAESATHALLQAHSLPTPVRVFFQTIFTDYMSLLLLRNDLDPNNPQCREALNAAVQLIENVDATDVPAAQQAGASLKQLIEVLLPHYQNKIDMFLDNLEHTIVSAERETVAAVEPMQDESAATDEEVATRIMQIPAGSWFSLQNEPDAQPLMVKLLWSNPHTHHLLFVDQHGLKRAHLSIEEVAGHLDQGTLKPIDIKSEGILGKLFSAIRQRLENTLKGNES